MPAKRKGKGRDSLMRPRKQVTYSQRPNHAARQAHARGEREFRTYDTSYIRPKRRRGPLIAALACALIIIVALCWAMLTMMHACSGSQVQLLDSGQQASFDVASGSGAQDIGKQLQDARLVGNAQDFTKRVNERGVSAQLKPGSYTFAGGTSLDDIISQIMSGPQLNTLTVPEGSTLSDIASAVERVSGGKISSQDFKAAASNASAYAKDYPFLSEAGTSSLEGFLFPKTYDIDNNATADSIIRAMLGQYENETSSLDYSFAKSKGLSKYEVLKLASIVEKESDDADDHRAMVASVFYNRLASDHPYLESDATTAYEVGHNPSAKEVHENTPYSTYSNANLPPTPISAAGLACLQAVCSPAKTDYLYFYFAPDDNGDMQYHFSKTYEEHQSTYE